MGQIRHFAQTLALNQRSRFIATSSDLSVRDKQIALFFCRGHSLGTYLTPQESDALLDVVDNWHSRHLALRLFAKEVLARLDELLATEPQKRTFDEAIPALNQSLRLTQSQQTAIPPSS